jgi:hypothetical protein
MARVFNVTRTVQPELLDRLPASDPDALRSRRDLRLINALMANHRWLRQQVGQSRAIELGAGDGSLARTLPRATALDLAPRPGDLPDGITWCQGDLFETLPGTGGDTLVACLILHHFEAQPLAALGRLIDQSGAQRVVATEPHRTRLAIAQGYALFPFVNHITRHDMIVSIRAGFRRGELGAVLGLDAGSWEIVESVTLFGALRFEATRR